MNKSLFWRIIAIVGAVVSGGAGMWATHKQNEEEIDARIDRRIIELAQKQELPK